MHGLGPTHHYFTVWAFGVPMLDKNLLEFEEWTTTLLPLRENLLPNEALLRFVRVL